jgi:hypothetical protein
MTPIQELIARMNNINAEQLANIATKESEKEQLDLAIAYQEEVIANYLIQKAGCDVAIAEFTANIVLDNDILVILNAQPQN